MVRLDSMNINVEVKLLTGRDETMLSQLSERRRKKKLPETPLTDQMRQLIVSVDGNDNPEYISSFIEHMPARVSRKLRTIYSKIVPNINMNQYFVCDNCGHEGEVGVPFGANFFGLSSDYMEQVYEQFFLLKHHGGWSFFEAYNLPVGLRTWFVKRLAKHFKDEKKQIDKASKGKNKTKEAGSLIWPFFV